MPPRVTPYLARLRPPRCHDFLSGPVRRSISEPGLHFWAVRRVGVDKKYSDQWELESQVPRPLTHHLLLSRTCSCSERLGAGMWSVPWLSFGAAA